MTPLVLAALVFPFLLGRRETESSSVGTVEARSPIPGLLPEARPKPPDTGRAMAARAATAILKSRPGQEDREVIRRFQAQEGLKDTGFYGPSTALRMAQAYGIVPPPVRYWGKGGVRRRRARYAEALRSLAARDSVRAEEWLQAAKEAEK